jgi:lipopolysaccharide/colanic/teichoic acid biosynthesis glycosyltransferase
MTEPSTRLSAVLLTPRPTLRTPVSPLSSARPVPGPPAGGIGTWVKVAAETVLAAVLLIVSLPIILGCVLLVRLTSAGPALYIQSRVGRGGRVFKLYKIRTMSHDCESLTGPRWCMPGDPRITPVGKVLRKLHMDELPQLWNVLCRDMSLIGPRPERPEIVRRLRQMIEGYDRRHAVLPGITGFAQIHLPPDTCVQSVKNKLIYDLFYVRNRSAGLELFILFATGLKLIGLRRLYQRPPRRPTDEV